MSMLALITFALLDDEKHVLDKERLLDQWRGPLIALAVGGFVIAVLGHLFQSKLVVVTGIVMISAAFVIFPVLLYVRGTG